MNKKGAVQVKEPCLAACDEKIIENPVRLKADRYNKALHKAVYTSPHGFGSRGGMCSMEPDFWL